MKVNQCVVMADCSIKRIEPMQQVRKTGRLVRRERKGFVFIEPTMPAVVMTASEPKDKPKPQPMEQREQKAKPLSLNTKYVFRDRISGKIISRSKIGSMPHLYR